MIVDMDNLERLRKIRKAREAADAARAALMSQVEEALADGIRVSAIAHEARWSETYIRSIAKRRQAQ